jgi:hypothetical protein
VTRSASHRAFSYCCCDRARGSRQHTINAIATTSHFARHAHLHKLDERGPSHARIQRLALRHAHIARVGNGDAANARSAALTAALARTTHTHTRARSDHTNRTHLRLQLTWCDRCRRQQRQRHRCRRDRARSADRIACARRETSRPPSETVLSCHLLVNTKQNDKTIKSVSTSDARASGELSRAPLQSRHQRLHNDIHTSARACAHTHDTCTTGILHTRTKCGFSNAAIGPNRATCSLVASTPLLASGRTNSFTACRSVCTN